MERRTLFAWSGVTAASVAWLGAICWWFAAAPTVADAPGAEAETSPRPRAVEPSEALSEVTNPPTPRPGTDGRRDYHPAVLQIVTNFTKADATINDIPYPEYVEPGDQPGMVLPAGGPYTIRVTYNGNTKTYTIGLDPYEVRYLIVELSGYKGGEGKSRSKSGNRSGGNNKNEAGDGEGRVTVYSKPKGSIQVDGSARDQKTPGTINVSPGEHEVQVKFDDGQTSESKTVRVREGSRIKLFFRKN